MEYYSPAMSVNSDMTDEELDKYFATYIPLSNLPTPPPAKKSHTTTSSQTQTSPSPEIQGTFFSHAFPRPGPGLKCWKLLARPHGPLRFPCIFLVPRHSLLNIIEFDPLGRCSWRSGRHSSDPLANMPMISICTASGEERAGRACRCCMWVFGTRGVCG